MLDGRGIRGRQHDTYHSRNKVAPGDVGGERRWKSGRRGGGGGERDEEESEYGEGSKGSRGAGTETGDAQVGE